LIDGKEMKWMVRTAEKEEVRFGMSEESTSVRGGMAEME